MKFFDKWTKRRNGQAKREQRLAEVKKLGYELVDERFAYARGYVLKAPNGEILDNMGMGFANSRDALIAARRHHAATAGGSSSGMSLLIALAVLAVPAVMNGRGHPRTFTSAGSSARPSLKRAG